MNPVIKNSGIVDVEFGQNVIVINPVNLYCCKISDDVFIGPFVEIQKNVFIGKNTRIQSHTFICEQVTIGESCFIAHGVMFINDTFSTGSASGNNKNVWKPTNIGKHVSIGSNATILPVNICDDVVVGAGSVVTKDINEAGFYAGNPAKLLRTEK